MVWKIVVATTLVVIEVAYFTELEISVFSLPIRVCIGCNGARVRFIRLRWNLHRQSSSFVPV